MDSASKRKQLSVESLEGRALLSGFAHHSLTRHAVVAPLQTSQPAPNSVQGTISGSYSVLLAGFEPIIGMNLQMSGAGSLTVTPPSSPAVSFSAKGAVHLPPPSASQGSTTLEGGPFVLYTQGQIPGTHRVGVLFVNLKASPAGTASASSPITLTAQIVAGLGAYRGASATETATLTLTPNGSAGGTFTIDFEPNAST